MNLYCKKFLQLVIMSCTFGVFNVWPLSKRAFGGKQVEMILLYLFRTSRIRIIRSTQILARVFIYLLSFPRLWTLSVERF